MGSHGSSPSSPNPPSSGTVGISNAKWVGRPLRWSLIYLSATFGVFFFTKAANGIPSLWPTSLWLRWRRDAHERLQVARPTRLPAPACRPELPANRPDCFFSPLGHCLWPCLPRLLRRFRVVRFCYHHRPRPSLRIQIRDFRGSGICLAFIQIVTLTAGFMTLLIPLLILWWQHLSLGLRLLGFWVFAFLAPFAYIGTNQGFGYAVVLALVGVAAARAAGGRIAGRCPGRLAYWWQLSLTVGLAFFLAGNIGRSDAFGLQREYNPRVASVVGEPLAAAFEWAVFYPTHGYRGLAETLTQPFVFSGGYGNSRALNRYAVQYLGLPDAFPLTYPVRTEYATGYPSGLIWHTAYPWLASDLTFPGARPLHGVGGMGNGGLVDAIGPPTGSLVHRPIGVRRHLRRVHPGQ